MLVKLSWEFPDMIDALPLRLVGDALEEEWEGLGEIKRRMSYNTHTSSSPHNHHRQPLLAAGSPLDGHEQLRYKYLICTHGNGNQWVGHRFRSQLSTGALVFRQVFLSVCLSGWLAGWLLSYRPARSSSGTQQV
jgi:hypothetical protein